MTRRRLDGIQFLLGATVWAYEDDVRVVTWTQPTGTARTTLAMLGGHGPRIPGSGWGACRT